MKHFAPKRKKHYTKAARKLKKIILNTITSVALITFLICCSAVNSTQQFYIPLIIGVICFGWVHLYLWANGYIK